MLVVTTSASKDRRVKIRELGKIVGPGIKFDVSPERYAVLAGNNRYRAKFVEAVGEPPVPTPEPVVTPVVEETPAVEETPEIWVIEPGKEPVQVDENLEPIKEEPPVEEVPAEEEKPKKKRGRKKKEEVEVSE